MPSTTPLWPHTAVLMIGGRSRRMGMAKHDLKSPDGRTMLEKAVECLRLTATKNTNGIGAATLLESNRHVVEGFVLQSLANLTCGDLLAVMG